MPEGCLPAVVRSVTHDDLAGQVPALQVLSFVSTGSCPDQQQVGANHFFLSSSERCACGQGDANHVCTWLTVAVAFCLMRNDSVAVGLLTERLLSSRQPSGREGCHGAAQCTSLDVVCAQMTIDVC